MVERAVRLIAHTKGQKQITARIAYNNAVSVTVYDKDAVVLANEQMMRILYQLITPTVQVTTVGRKYRNGWAAPFAQRVISLQHVDAIPAVHGNGADPAEFYSSRERSPRTLHSIATMTERDDQLQCSPPIHPYRTLG
jgi:hypothetical protein